MTRWFAGIAVALGILAANCGAQAAERVALVIGNGNYQHTGQLANPVNDAALMAQSLRGVGFEVVTASDATHKSLLNAMSEFGRVSQGAQVALFFYAGHGLEVAGRNWILPVDADIQASSDLPSAAVKVDDVLELMELSEARIRLVVLDACRNNPLPRSLTRSTTRGLAKIDASAAGTMVVFSAAPGEVALDGSGANSPFSQALASHIGESGLEVRQMIGRVRQDVMAATNNKQVPWVNEAIAGDFFLAGKGKAAAPARDDAPAQALSQSQGPSGELSVELAFWDSVKDSRNKALIDLYLQKYPDGAFKDLAHVLLAALDNEQSQPRATQQPPQPQTFAALPQPVEDPAAQLDRRAREFVLRFNAAFSAAPDVALDAVRRLYASNVDFYGKPFTLDQIVRDKSGLIARWPQRTYQAPENEISTNCNAAVRICNVRSVVYWSVSSAERNKSASGVSQTDLQIDFRSGEPRIVYEVSEALKRN